MSSASLRALLATSIDYAGLFPPASLSLEPALRNHAHYVRSGDAWMLGTFILPIDKFGETSASLSQFDVVNRLRISALGAKSEIPEGFHAALKEAAEAIRVFNARNGAVAAISQIEMALPTNPGAVVAEIDQALAGLAIPAFWEAAADDAELTIGSLAGYNRKRGASAFGFKLRTGGVIASAFPSSVQIARALVCAVEHRVPLKFTAGLHHPIRQFHSSVQAKMHGFLNVLGAGVMAAEHAWNVQQTAAMLEDEEASDFVFDDAGFSWREWKITTERIEIERKLFTSLGSCSFDEPRDDLRALNLF